MDNLLKRKANFNTKNQGERMEKKSEILSWLRNHKEKCTFFENCEMKFEF